MDRATFEHFVSGVTSGVHGYTLEIRDQSVQRDSWTCWVCAADRSHPLVRQ